VPATSATAANPVQRENSRPGNPWLGDPSRRGDGDPWLCFGAQRRPGAKLPPARGRAGGLALSGARLPAGVVPGVGALDHGRTWLPLEPCRDCTAPANHARLRHRAVPGRVRGVGPGAGQYVGGLQPLGRQEPLPIWHQHARTRGVVRSALRPAVVLQHHPQRRHGPGNRAERRPGVRDGHDGAGLGAR
jgi:hypothetical protein